MTPLPKEFYLRDTIDVAKGLLGCKLVHKSNNGELGGIIVETEAYTYDDPACHAFKGLTPRSAPLFEEGGIAYVYFIYGMYYCFNVVTGHKGNAGAVLIRALDPIAPLKNTNGPGKLCREMDITKEQNLDNLCDDSQGLWIEHAQDVLPSEVIITTRIGIKVAADYPWRFYVKGNPYVSKK